MAEYRMLVTRTLARARGRRALMAGRLWRVQEVARVAGMMRSGVDPQRILTDSLAALPALSRQAMIGWSERVLSS